MIQNGRYVPSPRERIAILLAAILLAWIAARGAVQASFRDVAPAAAAAFAPADGASLANLARARVAARSGEIDDTTRTLYRSALLRGPLLPDPLEMAGLDAAAAGDTARAEQLMLEARDRDPRSALVRFWLLDHFVRSRQFARAMDEVGPAVRLQPDAMTVVMTVLSAVANDPDGRKALAGKLATRPFWRTAFFQAAANGNAPDTLLTLLAQGGTANTSTKADDEQRAVFMTLINAGDGLRAYHTWKGLLPASYRARAQGIYDGNFSGLPGAQPFNWILQQNEIGTARRVRAPDLPQGTALEVHYFGSTGGALAEQYIHAPPGSYQLRVAARRRSQGATGGRLGMEVRCGNGDVMARLPLEPLDRQLKTVAVPVQVTPGCEIVRVRLMASPGEMFSELEAQVTGIEFVADGAQVTG